MFADRGREQAYLGLNKLILKFAYWPICYIAIDNTVMCTETHLLIVWYSTYYHRALLRTAWSTLAIPILYVGYPVPIIPIRYEYDWYERWVIVGDA